MQKEFRITVLEIDSSIQTSKKNLRVVRVGHLIQFSVSP